MVRRIVVLPQSHADGVWLQAVDLHLEVTLARTAARR